jgi:hypothetical protein
VQEVKRGRVEKEGEQKNRRKKVRWKNGEVGKRKKRCAEERVERQDEGF